MTETREKILNDIAILSNLNGYKEQRLGQLLYNYVIVTCPNNDPFFLDDEDFLNLLEEEIVKYELTTGKTIDR